MKQYTSGPAEAGSEGEENGNGGPLHILPLNENCNTDLARRKVYENCGLEMARRGEINVSQFTGSFIDLPEDVQAELFKRMQDFTRLPASAYEAAGAIRLPKRFIPLSGGRS